MRALQSLPSNGAAMLLIDYGTTADFAPHQRKFRLSEYIRGHFECFGESYMVRFHRGGHDLQAHVVLGTHANADRRRQALAILDSLQQLAGAKVGEEGALPLFPGDGLGIRVPRPTPVRAGGPSA
jgi:hypothetical protein